MSDIRRYALEDVNGAPVDEGIDFDTAGEAVEAAKKNGDAVAVIARVFEYSDSELVTVVIDGEQHDEVMVFDAESIAEIRGESADEDEDDDDA